MLGDDDDLRNRFRRTALDLFTAQGFDRTTTAQIASAAGVTSRTFYRYYPDKRDVMFEGEAAVRTLLVASVANAPTGTGPLDAMMRGLRVFQPVLEAFRPFAKGRHEVFRHSPALREREAMRTRALIDTLAATLVGRGVDPAEARLAATTAMGAFVVATHAWLDTDEADLAPFLDRCFAELKALLAAATG